MKAIDDYLVALQEIKAATLSEKIVWKRNSANSYTFKTVNHDLEDLILTIQKIESGNNFDYLFSLVKQDFDSSEILLSLDTSTNNVELRDELSDLYSFIEYHVDLQNLDGLKDFIDSVNSGDSNSSILG